MSYRKGELTLRAVERDWPVAIVIERAIWATMIHLMSRHIAPRSRGICDRSGTEHVVLYLRDRAIAERIRAFADGHYYGAAHIVETAGRPIWEPPGLPRPPINRHTLHQHDED